MVVFLLLSAYFSKQGEPMNVMTILFSTFIFPFSWLTHENNALCDTLRDLGKAQTPRNVGNSL